MTANIAARTPTRSHAWGRPLSDLVSVVYVVAFVVWRLLIASPLYEAWWWLKVSEIFGHFAYAPAPILLVAALVRRRRVALLALLIPLLWFGGEYGRAFMPASQVVHAEDETPTLRVMTWNVKRQIGFTRNVVDDLAAVAGVEQPDFIFLQETGPNSLQHLQPLKDTWPYQVAGIGAGRVYLAFASKWPIVDSEVVDDWYGCYCIRMTIDWQGQLIDVLAVHVAVPRMYVTEWHGIPILRGFDTSPQDVIFDALLAEIAASQRPLIVAGDFNTNEREPNYTRMLDAGMRNAFAETGWGFGLTFPRPGAALKWLPFPLIRIDHVFYDAAWHAERAWTGTIRSSDHLYLFADLRLQNSP